jgi:pimeloyl-ACP methyl ester carboxylesterase
MEEVAMPNDLPAWVLRGSKRHDARFVFLPGMCSHPLGYAQSFQYAAAERGDLVTLQGDLSCGGDAYRRWSYDLSALTRRLDAVLAAAAIPAEGLTLIGYSQGAELAERLAARDPRKFTRVVLIGSPIVPSPQHLGHTEGAVLMAGTRDAQANMQEGLRLLRGAGIPATFLSIPGARHGEMGTQPEATMGEAFAWLDARGVTRAAGVR